MKIPKSALIKLGDLIPHDTFGTSFLRIKIEDARKVRNLFKDEYNLYSTFYLDFDNPKTEVTHAMTILHYSDIDFKK